jgi:IS30 family transposase
MTKARKNQYKQLTLEERFYIETELKLGVSTTKISQGLERARKTISNEIKRNSCPSGSYCFMSAKSLSDQRRSSATKADLRQDNLINTLIFHVKRGLSPEQISGRLKEENCLLKVSTSMIYRTIHWLENQGRDLLKYLPRKGKSYRIKLPAGAGCKLIPNRVDIDERPAIVDDKIEVGHWEGDTVKYTDGYLVTMVERVTKMTVIRKVRNKTKADVTKALKHMMKPYKHLVKTITFDNGGEFAGHQKVAKSLDCKVYFAKPYKSCQRGLNENTNGLIRRIWPKRTAIWHITHKEIDRVAFELNIRPRKTLNYLIPFEKLTGESVTVMSTI